MSLRPFRRATLGLPLFACSLVSAAWAAEPVLSLKPAQVQSLGVRVQVVNAVGSTQASYPATVAVPSEQERVVAAPLQGLVDTALVSVGDVVKRGQVLATMCSAQAQELARDVLTTQSQAALAQSAATRDEQLFKEGLIAQSRLESSRALDRQAHAVQRERQRALSDAGASGDGSRITLRAPINGVVLARPVVVGQRVEQSTPLFHIAALSTLWLEIQVPAGEAASIQRGDTVKVAGIESAGRVIAVGQSVLASSQSVMVRAEVRQGASALRVGQAVEAQLARAGSGLAQLPAQAVMVNAARAVVFVESSAGQYRATEVTLVSGKGDTSTVRGLPPGSKVVVQGTAALQSLLASAQP
jgi:cobalt-zinc-cadmium efflux system membrane fusion protein